MQRKMDAETEATEACLAYKQKHERFVCMRRPSKQVIASYTAHNAFVCSKHNTMTLHSHSQTEPARECKNNPPQTVPSQKINTKDKGSAFTQTNERDQLEK